MELFYKYTIEEVEKCNQIALVYSSEILVPQEFDNYSLGYEKFSNVVKIKQADDKSYKLYDQKDVKYNYVLFLSELEEVVGFSQLQSQLDFTRYEITELIINITFRVTDNEPVIVNIDCNYDFHINRTSQVHKQLFENTYKNKTVGINSLKAIDREPTFCVSDLQEFYKKDGKYLRYSGNYLFSSISGEIGIFTEGVVPLRKEIIDSEILSIFKKGDNLRVCYKDSKGLHITNPDNDITYNGKLLEVFGDKVITDKEVIDIVNGTRIPYGSHLRVVYDQANSNFYFVNQKANYICNRLSTLLLRHDYSQSVSRLHSVSDSYLLYKTGVNYTFTTHEISIKLNESFEKLIPITSKLYLIKYSNGEYYLINVRFNQSERNYDLSHELLGYEYQQNGQTKYYFKNIEQLAKRRHTNIFSKILPFSFNGTLLTIKGNTLVSL